MLEETQERLKHKETKSTKFEAKLMATKKDTYTLRSEGMLYFS